MNSKCDENHDKCKIKYKTDVKNHGVRCGCCGL